MSTRRFYLLGFITICILLLISIYLQIVMGIIPCPLCTMQRLSFVILGFFFFLVFLLPNKHWIQLPLKLFAGIDCLLGIFFAARNIWLQHFPMKDNQGCSVSLQYMLDTFPFREALQKILAGSTDCSTRGFEFLSLNMAEWSLIWFFIFFSMILYSLYQDAK